MEANKRIEKWDILKFFLIFLVVLGHLIESFGGGTEHMNAAFLWIYTFHMPLFIFISGMFGRKTVSEKRYDKMAVFLFLFFITKIILFVSRIIAYGTFSFSLVQDGDLPWYMLAIFVFSLVTVALRKFSPAYIFPLIIIIACAAGYDSEIGDKFAAMRLIVFYPFFYAGYCFEPKKVKEFTDRKYVKIISAVIMIAFTVIVIAKSGFLFQFKPLLTGRGNFNSLKNYGEYGFFLRLIYYALVFVVGAAVISLTPNRLTSKGIIAKLGSRSVQVYMLHYVFVHFIDGRLKEYIPNTHLAVILTAAAVIITLICSLKLWEPIFKVLMNPIRKEK